MIKPISAPLRPAAFVTALLKGIFVAALSIVVLHPAKAEAADRAQIKAFLEVTGFDVALDSIAQSAGDAPKILGADAGDFGLEWERLTAEVFDTNKMQATALDILEETLSSDALFFAAEFYASDLGQRLVEVENASHMNEDGAGTVEAGERIVSKLVAEGAVGIADASQRSRRGDSEDKVRTCQVRAWTPGREVIITADEE